MILIRSFLISIFFSAIIYSVVITSGFCSEPKLNAGNNYALLIGVSRYPFLETDKQLRGPENDVRLLRDILISYRFKEDNITTLSTANEDIALKPKRNVILTELQKLVDKAKTNDNIVLYFSGHGSQQPNANESDGYDETFLPSDIGKWDGSSEKTVKNALIDNEIGDFVDKLLAKKASVWLIMDSCHSATGARGEKNSTSKARAVSPQDLGVPVPKQSVQSRSGTIASASKPKPDKTFFSTEKGAHFTGFYASTADKQAFEDKRISLDDKSKQVFYGNFTYALVDTLRQNASNRLSYRELQETISQKFVALGISDQEPQYEGEKDLLLFSNRSAEWGGYWKLRGKVLRTAGFYYIAAGKAQGLAKGMHLDIVPTVHAEEVIATTKITTISRGESELCLIDKEDRCVTEGEKFSEMETIMGENKKKGETSKRTIVFARLAEKSMIPTLKVYVSAKAQQGHEQRVKEKLDHLQQEKPSNSQFIHWVDNPQDAEVIIHFPSELSTQYQNESAKEVDSTVIWLQVLQNSRKYVKTSIPNKSLDNENVKSLFDPLIKKLYVVNKTLRLKELTKEGNDEELQQHIEINLFKKTSGEKTKQMLAPTTSPIKMSPGDEIDFTLKNNLGVQYIDIGLFMLYPSYQTVPISCSDADISSLESYPKRITRRIPPEEACVTDTIKIRKDKNVMLGRYYVLIIATTKEPQDLPEDYAYLLQPSINRGKDKDKSKIIRYLNYFSLRGGNRTGGEQLRLPDETKIFLRLIELDI